MGELRALVFMGMNPWGHREIHDTVRFLAAAQTMADRLYIDPPKGFRGAVLHPAYIPGAFRWQQTVHSGVTVYTPPFGFAPVRLGLRKLADRRAAGRFDRLLGQLYGPSWREQTLLYISSWSFTQAHFIQELKPKYLVFHILDDSFAFPEIKNNPRVLAGNKSFYQYMMAASSVVIAVSPELAGKYARLYHRNIHVLRNGVHVEHFRGRQGPPVPEMTRIPQPVLMYTGSINSWVDLPLLIKLADDRPGYSLVLIGHHFDGATDARQWQALIEKPNVHWLKSRPYTMLPGYIQHAAALLLPRTEDEHSLASDPLKLYEYLSTGKPVVSTALPAVSDFREYVYVAHRDDFAATVDKAMRDHDPARARRQTAMMEQHSWTARLQELGEILGANCKITFS